MNSVAWVRKFTDTDLSVTNKRHDRLCFGESLLLLNPLRYQNMNGTLWSQIVWVMFLAHHCLPKAGISKNYFRVTYYYTVLDNAGSDVYGHG